jgi:uncharacterized membrane protein AbrB (regulator of aidB expression)
MRFLFKKIPAAIMIIPMFITAIINSLFPQLLQMGGVTTALFSKAGVAPLVGAILFLCGTQLKIKEAPEAIKRGGVLLVAKFIAGYVTGTLVNKLFGPAGFLGISILAIFITTLSSNGAIYLALTVWRSNRFRGLWCSFNKRWSIFNFISSWCFRCCKHSCTIFTFICFSNVTRGYIRKSI